MINPMASQCYNVIPGLRSKDEEREAEREWRMAWVNTYLRQAMDLLDDARLMVGDSGLNSDDLLMIAKINRCRIPLNNIIQKWPNYEENA